MELIACFILALLFAAICVAFGGAIWGLGLWGIWHILFACGLVAATPMWWPCWAIGGILTCLFRVNIRVKSE